MPAFHQWRRPACSVLAWLTGMVMPGSGGVLAAEAATVPLAPTYRELWVPERSLAAALKTMPKAVLLTREQFQTLLRDATPSTAATSNAAPVPAVLRSARYAGSLGDRAALMSAEFIVEGLGDTWTELPLTLDPRWLGAVTVDGATAVSATDHAAVLVVRGTGRHVVRIDFAAPISESAGSRTLTLRAPGTAEATLALTVPDSLKLVSTLPFQRDQGTATFALPPGRDEFHITWTARDVPPIEPSGLFQDSRLVYSVDAVQVRADLTLGFHAALKNVPGQIALPVPGGAQVLSVEGTELARWSLAGDQILAEFQTGDRHQTDLRLQLALPVEDGATQLDLPAPLATGVHRASGTFTLLSHPGLRVRRVTTGALALRDDAQSPAAFVERPDFQGTWAFPVLLQAPKVEIERLSSRFTATLDTQITVARDAVRLVRHLTFQPRDGTLFSPRVTEFQPGEEIDTVTLAGGEEVGWRPIERGLTLTTPAGTAPGQSLHVVVSSTLRPPGWNQLADQPTTLSFTSAQVPGAEKVSGYLALDFDPSLRVTTPKTDGLESRDPRLFAGKLPLSGRLAWFRLDGFQLDLAVTRRTVEFDTAIALDVLPLLNSLEVEGQLDLAVAHGGLRELSVAFPPAMAASVRWQSPLLAEMSMSDDGVWRLKFHHETTATSRLRFHASLPLTDASTADTTERRFTAQVPIPVVATARRSAGTLVVEANSDTELSLTPQALDDLDPRDAPTIDGYAPRHRIVGGYSWRGGQPSLGLDGVRHRAGELAGTVVDSLVLDSVVSADGPLRHQAVLAIRSAGTQFLDLELPEMSRVLSVVIDDLAAKPIRGPRGTLRLPLASTQARLRIIYETPAEPMTGLGQTTLPPLTLAPTIPVLDTTWRLHLPEGFSYSGFDTNLTEAVVPPPPPSLAHAVLDAPLVAALISNHHRGRVLMEIERSTGLESGDFVDPVSGSKAMLGNTTSLPTELNIITSKETLSQVIKKRNLVERWKVADLDEAYARLSRLVKASEEPGTDLVAIEVRSRDKTEAAELANDVAEAYIARRKQIETERIQLAFQTLSHTRKAQEHEVERARNKMLEIEQKLGLVDLSAESPFAFTRDTEATAGNEAAFMDARRTTLEKESQVTDYKAQLETLKDKDGDALISAAASLRLLDPKSTAVYEQLLQDQKTLAQLQGSGLGDTHPDVVSLKAGIEAQQSQLNEVVTQFHKAVDRQTEFSRVNASELFPEIQKEVAEYKKAKDDYAMAQEILNKMIDEQERARVVNLMPRKPATIHLFAEGADAGNSAQARLSEMKETRSKFPTGTPLAVASPARSIDGDDPTKPVDASTADRLAQFRDVDQTWETSDPATGNPSKTGQSTGTESITTAAFDAASVKSPLGGPAGDSNFERPAMRAGLVPLAFTLPEGGRTVTFSGKFAPTAVSFRAEAWDRQVRRAWVWMVAGGLIFGLLNLRRRRPVLIGLLGAITLHFAPLLAARPEWTPIANALLVGWLVALAIALVFALARWARRSSSMGTEVAHA